MSHTTLAWDSRDLSNEIERNMQKNFENRNVQAALKISRLLEPGNVPRI